MEPEILAQQGKIRAEAFDRYQKVIRDYDGKIKRYDQEKEDIKAKAEKRARDKEELNIARVIMVTVWTILEIVIMLSSIVVLTKKKPLFYFGLVLVTGWQFFFWMPFGCFINFL